MIPGSKLAGLIAAAFACVFLSKSIAAEPAVTAKREGKQIIFTSDNREVLRYQAEPGELPRTGIKESFRRGGYLHPIHTPSGRVVTDDYPSNHIHHHGIWMPWTKTEFEGRAPDFWNMGDNKGSVEFVEVVRVWNEGGRAGFTARHQFVDLLAQPPKIALNETWEVSVAAFGGELPRHVIDFRSIQRCATDAPLKLPKYHYGGFGFRGNWAWNGPAAFRVQTSEGETDRKKANEARSKWCWIGGSLDGQTAGATILCHPSNYRFPQPMRLHPSEPFFCYAPQQLGDMEITPGTPYVSRYLIVVTDGEPSPERAEKWWKEWSETK
ncbi:MAG TPA: PmoA family protein [Chthoniobacteraceae bacterium]|nr:PmoA family protein [Chthoniobacteraceae bacterium]